MNSTSQLAELDIFVIKFVCEHFLQNGCSMTIPSEEILNAAVQQGFSRTDVEDSLILLGKQKILVANYTMNRKRYPTQMHPGFSGLEVFYQTTIQDYGSVIRQVALALLETNDCSPERESGKLAQKIGRSKMLVDHILELLEGQSHIHVHRSGGGYAHVGQVSPSLRRTFPI